MNNLFPPISLILPIRNESAYIEQGLDAILAQDFPVDCMEILVVDGMSTDNTREIITRIASQHPEYNIHVLDNPGKIVPVGMNIALRQAKGEIIIRVDGHTKIAPDFVRQCVETLQRTGADNVGGRMNAIGRNPFGNAVALATSTPFGIGGGRFHYSDEEEWVDTVYMGAWPRHVFAKIGMFDEELMRDQDDEFNYRLRAHDGKIFLSPKIKSTYSVRSNLRALWRQYYQYGYWKVRVLQKHPRQMSLRQFVPPFFVASLLLSILYSLLFSLFFHPLCSPALVLRGLCASWLKLSSFSFLIPLLYLIANLTASIWTVIKSVRATHHSPSIAHYSLLSTLYFLLILPIIFAILHLGYGLGFLIGLVKFANRWGDRRGKVPDWPHEYPATASP